MRTNSAIILILVLTSLTGLAQRQADLTKFVKVVDMAFGPISEIDSISEILTNKFIFIANDTKTETHKDIQYFFESYKISADNVEYNIYPTTIRKEHLTIQYFDYSDSYGWIGQTADSVFHSSTLTSLIFIPVFENIHKGQNINTICFKVTLQIYTEAKLNSDKDYKREEKIIELRKNDL